MPFSSWAIPSFAVAVLLSACRSHLQLFPNQMRLQISTSGKLLCQNRGHTKLQQACEQFLLVYQGVEIKFKIKVCLF